MTNEAIKVIAGVDTHADTHHVALITVQSPGDQERRGVCGCLSARPEGITHHDVIPELAG